MPDEADDTTADALHDETEVAQPEGDGLEADEHAPDPAPADEVESPQGSQRKEPRPGSRMTEQEIRWGKWLGLGSAVAFGILPQPWLGGQHLYQAGLGVTMGMLLWVVARQGFRIRTAIASYLFLFAFGDLFLFGALHIGYAFLLAFRSSREMGQHRAQERVQQRTARDRPQRPKRKRKGGEEEPPAPPPLRVTEPNRRYTPPKAKGKRRR